MKKLMLKENHLLHALVVGAMIAGNLLEKLNNNNMISIRIRGYDYIPF